MTTTTIHTYYPFMKKKPRTTISVSHKKGDTVVEEATFTGFAGETGAASESPVFTFDENIGEGCEVYVGND